MKNLILFMLLFCIRCSSQQKIADKKYMDMETTFQKYRDIKAIYNSSVGKNKQNLIYENGAYFKKSLYEKEGQERRFEPQKTDSKFLLQEGDKEFFVKDEGEYETIYTYQKDQLIERASVEKKNNRAYSIDNIAEGTFVKYNIDGNIIYLINYVQDENDTKKRDVMLRQEFVNNKLVIQRNYKKDFKTNQEQMLKKLPDNFYNSAVRYLDKIDFRTEFSMQNDVKKLVEHNLPSLKEKIEKTVKTKDNFYRELSISKTYNMDNYPIYNISIPDMLIGFWEMKIDGKTNEVIDIKLAISKE